MKSPKAPGLLDPTALSRIGAVLDIIVTPRPGWRKGGTGGNAGRPMLVGNVQCPMLNARGGMMAGGWAIPAP